MRMRTKECIKIDYTLVSMEPVNRPSNVETVRKKIKLKKAVMHAQQDSEKILEKTIETTIIQDEKKNFKEQIKKNNPIIYTESLFKEGVIQSDNLNSNKNSSKNIIIKNIINNEMTTYHHWSGSYTPDFFITVKNTILPINSEESFIINGEPIIIEYKAVFPYGYSSTDSIEYHPKEFPEAISISFDWHKNPRIIINAL